MMTANRFFVPNTEESFEGLVVLLPQCGLRCQENSGKQNSLEDVLKDINTLWVIHGRVAFQETQLIQVIGTQLESLANLYSDHDQEIDEEMTNKGGGRIPTFLLLQDQVTEEGQGTKLGFRSVDIARMLGISTRTLSRRRQELCMPLSHQHNISSLSD